MATAATPKPLPDFTLEFIAGIYTVIPNNPAALAWMIAHTGPTQRPTNLTAQLDHASMLRFCEEAREGRKTLDPLPGAATDWLRLAADIMGVNL